MPNEIETQTSDATRSLRASELIGLGVTRHAGGDSLGSCIDLIMDVEHHRIAYLLAGAPPHRALIERQALTLGPDAIGAEIDYERFASLRDGADNGEGPLDLTGLPAVLVGPFGFSIAPAMAGAVMNDEFTHPDDAPLPEIDQRHRHWHWLSRLRGLPIFETGGEIGTFDDIVLARGSADFEALVTASGETIPAARLSHVSTGGDSILLR